LNGSWLQLLSDEYKRLMAASMTKKDGRPIPSVSEPSHIYLSSSAEGNGFVF
jgi:hypothetical protein